MAWPCITRACCINRFWSELDHTDIAVPLVFTKYSDVAEVQHVHPQRQPGDRSVGHEASQPVSSEQQDGTTKEHGTTTAALGGGEASSWSVTRQDFRAWKTVRPERSCKPRDQYHPSEAPFNNETQYTKDYKPWPIPRKGDHPWIPKAGGSPTKGGHDTVEPSAKEKIAAVEVEVVEAETGVEKCEIEEKQQEKEVKEREKEVKKEEKEGGKDQRGQKDDTEKPQKKSAEVEKDGGKAGEGKGKGRAAADARNRQIKQDRTGSSYRTEFKAYTDVKPVRPIRAKSQYKLSTEQVSQETSYSSTYRGQQGAPMDNKQLERRRIRSLYNEPRSKVDRSTAASRNRRSQPPPSSTPHGPGSHATHPPRSVRLAKAKEQQLQRTKSATGGQYQQQQQPQQQPLPRKKSSITSLHGDGHDADADPQLELTPPAMTPSDPPAPATPDVAVSKYSKEMINRLAEGKE